MESSGSNATARVEVQNINAEKLAFETRITLANFESDGKITETPRDEDFLVFPPQGALPGQGRQVLRLQWLGEKLDASRAYYLSVNQLPVQLTESAAENTGAQVQILYHMKALVVVSPPGARPKVTVKSARSEPFQPSVEAQGAPLPPKVPGVSVTLTNTGKRHAMMAGVGWVIQGKTRDGREGQLVISPDELTKAIGTGYIAAVNGERTFHIPTSVEFDPSKIDVRFQQP